MGTIRLRFRPLEQVRVRVTLDPVLSAFGSAHGALRPHTPSLHVEQSAAARSYLERHLTEASDLPAVLTSPVVPLALLSLYPDADHTLAEHEEYLHSSAAAAQLEQELHDLAADGEPLTWQGPTGRADAWMAAHADVLVGLTRHLAPFWRRAEPALAREVERIGTALVRGTLRELLGSLSPRVHWDGDVLCLPTTGDVDVEVLDRVLYLVPRIDGTDLLSSSLTDRSDALYLSYRVPGLLAADVVVPARDHLSQLLGVPRAQLVRALDRPRGMGELAALLQLAPSSVTHHCTRLERAGIVARERRGQHVQVSRTPHGDELVDRSA